MFNHANVIPNPTRGGRHGYNSSIFVPPLHQSAESGLTPNLPGSGNRGDLGVTMSCPLSFPQLQAPSSSYWWGTEQRTCMDKVDGRLTQEWVKEEYT